MGNHIKINTNLFYCEKDSIGVALLFFVFVFVFWNGIALEFMEKEFS